MFVSNEYLLAHIQRRHSQHASQFIGGTIPLKEASNDTHDRGRENDNQMNAELLQELKDIKERLASTEKQLQQSSIRDNQPEVWMCSSDQDVTKETVI